MNRYQSNAEVAYFAIFLSQPFAMLRKNFINILHKEHFEQCALETFQYQAKHNLVYAQFLKYLKINPANIISSAHIPCLPIHFFKTHRIVSTNASKPQVFLSSGTTGSTSKHYVSDLKVYQQSYLKGFELNYGKIEDYSVLALLPSYLERDGSSLVYMVEDFIKRANGKDSGFYLDDMDKLAEKLKMLDSNGKKVLLIGVSFALLDLIEKYEFNLNHTVVMETGGMKGRRKELTREELHENLKKGFGVSKIHSEYGMTELLSQAYSKGDGLFYAPPWMKVSIRDPEDARTYLAHGKTGGVNIIDLANFNSCSFIATQDLGKSFKDEGFKILGRFDNSDLRGCNLLTS